MHARATGGNFFMYKQQVHKREFFNMGRVRIEKKVSEGRKKLENNVRNFALGKKRQINFFSKKNV